MNKRHYEHTLPNIRGSLSNTYGELTDFCILSYETGYYEIVFNLFHNELFLEVIKSILRCLKK